MAPRRRSRTLFSSVMSPEYIDPQTGPPAGGRVPGRATKGVTSALKKAGIEKPIRADGMHALRHLYASVLLDAGESIKALSSYLRHSDPGFTLRVYTHLLPSRDGLAAA
jgi:integrase